MRYKALLAVILVVFIAYMGFSHGQEVSGYKETIAEREGEVLTLKSNLKFELDMRDSELETLKNQLIMDKQNRANDKIVLDYIVIEQARISKRQIELAGKP